MGKDMFKLPLIVLIHPFIKLFLGFDNHHPGHVCVARTAELSTLKKVFSNCFRCMKINTTKAPFSEAMPKAIKTLSRPMST